MSVNRSNPWQCGSIWRRWEPHIHAPGTLLNDQFEGNWEGYLTSIEQASPTIEVLGVTDYFSIGCYKAVKTKRVAGRLSKIQMLFPNVEMRLDLETDKRRAVNVHLLFCPDDPDHEEQIERVLAELTFEYRGRSYHCANNDLQALGRAHNQSASCEYLACSEGARQFKVNLEQLRKLFRNDAWISRNCIVAVAASSSDGTAGMQTDSSFSALRQEIERFAEVVFAATPSTRDFWLGKNAKFDTKKLEAEYGGRKPCLHGSDAHSVTKSCLPDEDRYCWVKGDPTFETLRQVILEPEERVSIGAMAPDRHDASHCVAQIATVETPWLTNGLVPLNPGLVAIIGARGSGKTALADIIAIGTNITSPLSLRSSFIFRASHPVDYLGDAQVHLEWGDGTEEVRRLNSQDYIEAGEGIRYLSQQFVEQLCSAEGLAVELRQEIERVIFDATDATERFDSDSFEELADIHLNPILRERQTAKEAIEQTSEQVNAEEALQSRLAAIRKDCEERRNRIEKIKLEMKALLPKGKEARTTRLAELEAAVVTATTVLEKQKRLEKWIGDLENEVERIRKTRAPQHLSNLIQEYHEVGLSEAEWNHFEMGFKGDVDGILGRRKSKVRETIKQLTEGSPEQIQDMTAIAISNWPYNALIAERDNVKKEVGIDSQKQRRYNGLQNALQNEQRFLQRSVADQINAEGAGERRRTLIENRRGQYAEVFQSYLDEQMVLEQLYAPMQKTFEQESGSLGRLRFVVSREIDLEAWINRGEELLDLRKESTFRGHGALQAKAEHWLLTAWKTGNAEAVAEAMQNFIHELLDEIKKLRPSSIRPAQTPEWLQRVAAWLYSTEHIQLRYSVTYDGVDIEHLSPGVRGIVLLLLYLVIDDQDTRPLIIDQPEENLDPKSVFDELVPHFREARKRRQVIVVTHNANLVVNTDADQVIVASSERLEPGLPTVTYECGSIENTKIRDSICEILEGGEKAFLDRERRYRLHRRTPHLD